MAVRESRTGRTTRRRRRRPTGASGQVRAAAARAVEQILGSEEALALLVRRLEDAGWRIERSAAASSRVDLTSETPQPPRGR